LLLPSARLLEQAFCWRASDRAVPARSFQDVPRSPGICAALNQKMTRGVS
jgi:hypothetical protein